MIFILLEKIKVERRQVWKLGNHYLMCGDCTNKNDVKKLMQGKKASMIFTDAPYGVNYKGVNNDSRLGLKSLLDKAFLNMQNNSISGAVVYCFHSDKCSDIFHEVFRKYCYFSSMLIWKKKRLVLSWADYKSIHEPILYGWFKNGVHKFYGDRKQVSVWEFEREDIKGHPTPKPVELICKAIENSSKKNDIVIDFFGGSGSTLIACEKMNRQCYTMEIDEQYCDVIISRWEEMTGNKAELIEVENGEKG